MSLEQAILMREQGDREGIVALFRAHPSDPRIAYQCAWTHDKLGLEAEAVEFYEAALRLGLSGDERCGAYLGLGSTFRCLGRYQESLALLDRALEEFPHDRALRVFRALALYNLGQTAGAMEALLVQLVETTSDARIKSYARALVYYSDKLEVISPP